MEKAVMNTIDENQRDRYVAQLLDPEQPMALRIDAAFKLYNVGDDQATIALCKALEKDPSPVVRHEIAFSLGETSSRRLAGPALLRAMTEDEAVIVRHEAALALGTLNYENAVKHLESMGRSDPDPILSESAQIALQRMRLL